MSSYILSTKSTISPTTPSPLHPVHHPLLLKHDVQLWCKRDDLIHPTISGNKWRKLKYHLQFAEKTGKSHLISFGGAYSNHIHALAAAGQHYGLATTGIIRGDIVSMSNATLQEVIKWGMTLQFVDRATYRRRFESAWLAQFAGPNNLIIPEGGSSPLAIPGVAELVQEVPFSPDLWVLPCASGGTLAGLIAGKRNHEKILAISVLKGGNNIANEVCHLYPPAITDSNWEIALEYHDGGYAKFTPALWQWIETFTAQTGVPLEPIYSGKAMWALFNKIVSGEIKAKSRIIFIHTGGMQGVAGLREQGLI